MFFKIKPFQLLVLFLFLEVFFLAAGYAHGNEQTPLLKSEPQPDQIRIEKALELLSRKFDVQFAYNSELLSNLTVTNEKWLKQKQLGKALTELLKPFNLQFQKLNSKNYVIKPAEVKQSKNTNSANTAADAVSGSQPPDNTGSNIAKQDVQQSTGVPVKGKVIDENGKGISGVSVLVKGTNVGTTTNINGEFTIEADNEKAVLVFSSIGFLTEEILVGNSTVFTVTLINQPGELPDVVVVGYGAQRRKDLTGSVASVKSKDIANQPAASLATLLQGRVPGAFISQIDGNPNGNAAIFIRGPLSINAVSPLVIVDGVPFQGTNFNFNAQDIESVDVLKDASAAAIYGANGSAGVILVKTKKGTQGKLKVGLNSSLGFRQVFNLPSTLRRDDYIAAKTAYGFDPVLLFGPENSRSSLPNTNWFDEMYRTGVETNNTLFISGGSDKSTYYLSGNYARITGTRIANKVERFTFRLNSEHRLSKKLKIGQSLYSSLVQEDPNSTTNQGDLSFRNTPVMKVYDPSNPVGGWGKVPTGFQGGNDVQGALGNLSKNENFETLLIFNADYEIIKGLHFRTVASANLNTVNNERTDFRADIGTAISEARYRKNLARTQNLIATHTLNYSRTFGYHSLNVLAGYEARKSSVSNIRGENVNPLVALPQDFSQFQSITTASLTGQSSSAYNRILSQFGRIEYAYDSKYLLTANVRRDAFASKFGPLNRWGVFPGFSLGWTLSNEKFMEWLAPVAYVKFRAGYGSLGNAAIPDFLFASPLGTGFSNDFGGGIQNSVNIINQLPNKEVAWETAVSTNIGADLRFFKNRLGITIDYYDRQTKDMLYQVNIAPSGGLGQRAFVNVGQMSNKGFEFNVEYKDKIGRDFTFSAAVNGATNKNKLLALDPRLTDASLSEGLLTEAHNNVLVNRSEVGRELGNFYGYNVLGIYQSDAAPGEVRPRLGSYTPRAGDLIYEDLNKDGVINTADRTFIGSPWPKLVYGLNFSMTWKGFDLTAFFNGVYGNKLYNAFQTYQHTFYSDYTSGYEIFKASGFNGNGVTSVPRIGTLTAADNNQNQNWSSVNSYHVQNGSYLRLRNLQLGYTAPATLMKRMRVSSLRFFVMGDNILTFTKYKGINPDIGNEGVLSKGIDNANYRYPVSRIMTVGFSAEF